MRNTIKKLAYMPYAQAHVEITPNGDTYLFSYTTLVIELTHDGWLTCTGTYSATTRKHIGAFMREYITWPNGERATYHDAKKAYMGGYRLNVTTGELEFLE